MTVGKTIPARPDLDLPQPPSPRRGAIKTLAFTALVIALAYVIFHTGWWVS
jgi:hypothetical protein